jgi:hypothetical protein
MYVMHPLRIGLCKTIIKPIVPYGAEAWILMETKKKPL